MDGAEALRLHPSPDYVSDHIRRTGDYFERVILDEIRGRVAGGVLVDVGAMIGNHTAYLARFVAHDAIHAFEPAPVNLEVLVENAAPFPTVRVHPLALSDRARKLAMTVDQANRGHGVVVDADVDQAFDVPAATLDSFGLEDVALIKVDVEGHEPEVLAGSRETIARWHPLIVIEDWRREYGPLLPGYRIAATWERDHQTFLYEWPGPA